MKRVLTVVGLVTTLSGLLATPAFAMSTGNQGQPNQSCQDVFGPNGPFTPSGFNTTGFNHATTVYAGSQPQNSSNPKSVSQYDVACFQAGSH